ncbi:protein of unknown function [Modestobacter italicus]|uniref:Uncharacterized protein n=1 Tax=Modestobacter italicus (strain DSM 44449 / CECT 9708 / BC 501) TaxID=2732864 RepID=I4F0X1_MODI5|nr:hypothetical protein [Modestobacter marinus]CCH89284.1 protein of unknown function [Modestobacter marinus]
MTTALMCRAEDCDQESRTAWINTMNLTARGHEQLPVCRDHLEVLADRGEVRFTPAVPATAEAPLVGAAVLAALSAVVLAGSLLVLRW